VTLAVTFRPGKPVRGHHLRWIRDRIRRRGSTIPSATPSTLD